VVFTGRGVDLGESAYYHCQELSAVTGAGGSVRLAYGNFSLQKVMAEYFRRVLLARLFCHPRDDLIESDGGFHQTDSTRHVSGIDS
jgi:hypothetical protein